MITLSSGKVISLDAPNGLLDLDYNEFKELLEKVRGENEKLNYDASNFNNSSVRKVGQ